MVTAWNEYSIISRRGYPETTLFLVLNTSANCYPHMKVVTLSASVCWCDGPLANLLLDSDRINLLRKKSVVLRRRAQNGRFGFFRQISFIIRVFPSNTEDEKTAAIILKKYAHLYIPITCKNYILLQ